MGNKKILIVSSTEGFMVKGLETKLKSIKAETTFSTPDLSELGRSCKYIDLIIVFTDDTIGRMREALVFLKDFCVGNDQLIMVIGKKEEYEVLTRTFPDNYVLKFYERPLDMEILLADAESYLNTESQFSRRKSILIVDDDVSYMSMIMDWLKNDYRVSLANSGMEAITWLANNKADLILLDYEMPITSGPQVLEMIRSDASTAKIPVMFLTGKGDKESVMKVLALKPVGYLLKTVGRKELMENIAGVFAVS